MSLAATGPQAPLLLTDSATYLPGAVTNFLRHLRGKKPNQAYVLGGDTTIGPGMLQALDGLLAARGGAPRRGGAGRTAEPGVARGEHPGSAAWT